MQIEQPDGHSESKQNSQKKIAYCDVLYNLCEHNYIRFWTSLCNFKAYARNSERF